MKSDRTPANSHPPRWIHIGRWTPQVLFSLHERPHRHGDLRRRLRGVSQRMFTRTLRRLESSGLIDRSVRSSKVLAVEYSLTPEGRTLIAPLKGMCRWAQRYAQRVTAQVRVRGPEATPPESSGP